MQEIKINSAASYHPPYVVSNDQLAAMMDTSDEWIQTRTGISERHISQGENTADLAQKVGQALLKQADLPAGAIDLLIVATMSPDANTPATAAIVQGRLGADKAVAFDVSAACTGFIYALNIADSLLEVQPWQHAMVIGAEVLSKLINWHDRTTAVLFGDGAGGVILSKTKGGTSGIMGRHWATKGKLADKIVAGKTWVETTFPSAVTTLTPFQMAGRDVYRFATHEVPISIQQAVHDADITLDQVDYFLLHQANARIVLQIAKKLGQPLAKFPLNIDRYGNTAGASEPVLLAESIANGTIKRGDIIALTGFGGGLSTGTIILRY